MNRAQFMKQLEKLLSDISEEERKEALDYYESYFDDAGPEREAEVLRELGSPGKGSCHYQGRPWGKQRKRRRIHRKRLPGQQDRR